MTTPQDPIELELPSETINRCREHGAEWLGDRIEYAVSGREADRSTARKIFERYNFSGCIPERPKAESMLKRASREGHQPKGYITREFVSPNEDTPIAIHVTKVTGKGEGGDDYTCLARVRIGFRTDPATGETVGYAGAAPPEGLSEYPDSASRDRARWIAQRTNYLLDHVAGTDLGNGIRKALSDAGAVQSLGGGNNYFAPIEIAERLFPLFSALRDELGIFYLRDPKTSLGAPHERQAIGKAAQSTLVEKLLEVRAKLEREIVASENPDSRKRETYIQRQLENLRALGEQLSAYKSVVEAQVLQPLEDTKQLYQRHFSTLLGGEKLAYQPKDDPFDFLVPEAAKSEAGTTAADDFPDFEEPAPAPEPSSPVSLTEPSPAPRDDETDPAPASVMAASAADDLFAFCG